MEQPRSVTCESVVDNDINQPAEQKLTDCSPSFRELVPKPHLSRPVSQARKRQAGHAEELTSTPYKNKLMDSESEAVDKGVKLAKRKLSTASYRKSASKQEGRVQKAKRIKKQESKKSEKHQSRGGKGRLATAKNDDDKTVCLYCAERWLESKGSYWIKCQGQCEQWAHTACAGVGAKDKHYVCKLCQ